MICGEIANCFIIIAHIRKKLVKKMLKSYNHVDSIITKGFTIKPFFNVCAALKVICPCGQKPMAKNSTTQPLWERRDFRKGEIIYELL